MKKLLNKNNEMFYETLNYQDKNILIKILITLNEFLYFKNKENTTENIIFSQKQIYKIEEYILKQYAASLTNNISTLKARRRVLRVQKCIKNLIEVLSMSVFYKTKNYVPKETNCIIRNALISNTGHKYISIKNRYNRPILKLALKVNNKHYTKEIAIGINYSFKYALYSLIKHRCDILGEECPEDIDYDTGIKYIASILTYTDPIGDDVDNPIVFKLPVHIQSMIACNKHKAFHSDTTNTGYTRIFLYKSPGNSHYTLVSHANKQTKEYMVYGCDTYKSCLDKAIAHRCSVLNLDIPGDIDYSIGIEWLLSKGDFLVTESEYEIALKDELSTTNYKNISMYRSGNIYLVACSFRHNGVLHTKSYSISKKPYREILDKLIKFKCDILGYPIPKNIDYTKGMDTYLSLLNKYSC